MIDLLTSKNIFLIDLPEFILCIFSLRYWFLWSTTSNIRIGIFKKTIEFILSVTMTKALFADFSWAGISQGWTLTLEEMFYFTAPIYFILIRKSKYWLIILPVVIFIAGYLLKSIFLNVNYLGGFLQNNLSVYIFEFFGGIGLAIFILKNKNLSFKIHWATYFGIFILFIYLLCKQYIGRYIDLKTDIGHALENVCITLLGIVPLLWGLIHENTFIKRFLSSPLMIILGKSSYIFYLIHKGFFPVFINDYITDNKLMIFILLNIVSIVLFHYIEEPLNKFIRKKYSS